MPSSSYQDFCKPDVEAQSRPLQVEKGLGLKQVMAMAYWCATCTDTLAMVWHLTTALTRLAMEAAVLVQPLFSTSSVGTHLP